ncbi:MAG TPA: DinB family protein [Thermoanaerobaculia bacterium]|nr:DinB family protein [Thermoanaerobaculia bacterium]
MNSNAVASYRRWLEYEKDSHAKVLASFATVPADRRAELQRAIDLLDHIAAARRMWLFRFGVLPSGPADIFPRGASAAEVAGRIAEVEAAWSAYLERLTDADLERSFEYQSLDGGRFRNTFVDILTQLFGHSWYHRGQIASVVRACGGEPAVTDFVFWTREPI